uniref:MADF domain-containing protein n=1 Tax=Ciona savignyi TaxID=51511 RepID=H2ZQ64_CIOSA
MLKMETAGEEKFDWNLVNTNRLITLYKEHAYLYDKNRAEYRNKVQKNAAIQYIADVLGTTAGNVFQKIRGLRTQYVREKSKIPSAGMSNWLYYDSLHFLNEFSNYRTTRPGPNYRNIIIKSNILHPIDKPVDEGEDPSYQDEVYQDSFVSSPDESCDTTVEIASCSKPNSGNYTEYQPWLSANPLQIPSMFENHHVPSRTGVTETPKVENIPENLGREENAGKQVSTNHQKRGNDYTENSATKKIRK